ncbi:MAG TPA: hypothetical protein VMB84_10745 [Stellaceae bacterium]|nr:hypothetical protein [Stellaceae bacterium]
MTAMLRPAMAAAVAFLAAVASASAEGEEVNAIITDGKADLTMCRQQMMLYHACYLYHHVPVPGRIALGDKVHLRYGSNPKHYDFPVERIMRSGDSCTVYSQRSETEEVEKMEIAPCAIPAPAP